MCQICTRLCFCKDVICPNLPSPLPLAACRGSGTLATDVRVCEEVLDSVDRCSHINVCESQLSAVDTRLSVHEHLVCSHHNGTQYWYHFCFVINPLDLNDRKQKRHHLKLLFQIQIEIQLYVVHLALIYFISTNSSGSSQEVWKQK